MYFKISDIIRQNLLLLPYMVSVFDYYVIVLYLINGRAKVLQRRQRCDRRNEEVDLTRAYQRSVLDIGQAAKPIERHSAGQQRALTYEKKESPEIRTSLFHYNLLVLKPPCTYIQLLIHIDGR